MRGSKVFKAVKNICFSHAQTLMLWAAYLLSNQLKNPVILSPRHSYKWEEISVELCVSAESVYENASLCVCKKKSAPSPLTEPRKKASFVANASTYYQFWEVNCFSGKTAVAQ